MLRVENLSVGYEGREIVHDVSFDIEPGTFTCILGPNGCGKTTLMKSMLHLLPAWNGRVTCDGMLLSASNAADRARKLAYIPQAHRPPFPFRVEEVVLLGRISHMGPLSRIAASDRAAAQAAMEQVGIEHLADTTYTTLSGGQRQLVIIARALAQQTPYLFMDEPTSNLDFGNQYRVLETVARLAREGLTIVAVNHDPAHAFYCADRVMVMQDGRFIADGPPGPAMSEQRLSDLYRLGVEVHNVRLRDDSLTPVAVPVQPSTSDSELTTTR